MNDGHMLSENIINPDQTILFAIYTARENQQATFCLIGGKKVCVKL